MIISEDSRRSPKSSEEVRSLPKTSEVCRSRAHSQCFSLQKSEIARKVLSYCHLFILHSTWVWVNIFWKLCQAKRQQLTFFNQAWEIGPQAWAGVRSKFSTRRRESWQVYKRDQGVEFRTSKNKASWWFESGLNMGPQYASYKSSALTARLS